jgi:cysteine synthase
MSFTSLPRPLLLLSLGIALGATTTYLLTPRSLPSPPSLASPYEEESKEDIVDGVEGLIGNTKLLRIRSLSAATGCEILAKAEVFPAPNRIT